MRVNINLREHLSPCLMYVLQERLDEYVAMNYIGKPYVESNNLENMLSGQANEYARRLQQDKWTYRNGYPALFNLLVKLGVYDRK